MVLTFPSSIVRYVDLHKIVKALAKQADYFATEISLIKSYFCGSHCRTKYSGSVAAVSSSSYLGRNAAILALDEKGCLTTHLLAAKDCK